MVASSGRPTRKVTSEKTKYAIEIFSEGEKTEVQYFIEWHRHHRGRVVVTFPVVGRGPLQLVEAAARSKQKAQREERRGRGRAPDAFWCVFDIDEHPDIPRAIEVAADNGIDVAISNPCIELWLYLHYEDHRRWDHRHDIQHALKACSGIDKTLAAHHLEFLIENYEIAHGRAIALDKMHDDNATDDRNPSSGVWRLVEAIRSSPSPGAGG